MAVIHPSTSIKFKGSGSDITISPSLEEFCLRQYQMTLIAFQKQGLSKEDAEAAYSNGDSVLELARIDSATER